jgi:apolipoprotein N-acyltransferase
MANTWVFILIKERINRKVLLPTFIFFLTFIFFVVYGLDRLRFYERRISDTQNSIKVGIVQGNFDIQMSWDWERYRDEIIKRLKRLSADVATRGVDLIIWTETVILDKVWEASKRINGISEVIEELGVTVLLGAPFFAIDESNVQRSFNSAFLLDRFGNIKSRYDKVHLVPWGEYFPAERFLYFLKDLIPQWRGYTSYDKGERFVIFKLDNSKASFGVLICFEGIFGDLVRKFTSKGCRFLVNITNDAWSNTAISHYQHFIPCVFRAVENRIFYVRAGNTGISAVIDSCGRIRSSLKLFKADVLSEDIKLLKPETFYVRFGDIFGILCTIFSFGLITASFVLSLKNRKKALN